MSSGAFALTECAPCAAWTLKGALLGNLATGIEGKPFSVAFWKLQRAYRAPPRLKALKWVALFGDKATSERHALYCCRVQRCEPICLRLYLLECQRWALLLHKGGRALHCSQVLGS